MANVIIRIGREHIQLLPWIEGMFIFIISSTVLLAVYFISYQFGIVQEIHRRVVIFLVICALVLQGMVLQYYRDHPVVDVELLNQCQWLTKEEKDYYVSEIEDLAKEPYSQEIEVYCYKIKVIEIRKEYICLERGYLIMKKQVYVLPMKGLMQH